MRIIQAILEGERDAAVLARLRDERCKNDEATIALALQGNWRDEHLFALRQAVELYRVYAEKITDLDAQIEVCLKTFTDRSQGQSLPALPGNRRRKKPGKHEPTFETRRLAFQMAGVDLATIDGIGPHAALQLLSEIGTDMTRWPTEKHFCSWLCLCPGVNKTGGRTRSRSGKTRPTASRAARVLRLCAQTLLRAQCALGAFARRIRTRLGAPKAITAVAHKLAKLVYNLLKYGQPYVDQGVEYYEQRYRQRMLDSLHRRAAQLGYELTAKPQTE